MLSEDRRLRILAFVRERGYVTIAALCKMFEVSEATIRRDLDALAEEQQIRRLRGGAGDIRTERPEPDLRSFDEVAAGASRAKRAIAERAARFIEDGDVVALDSGTTVAAMSPFLVRRSVTVVTASLPVVEVLQAAASVDIIVVGGVLRPSYGSVVGHFAQYMYSQLRVDKAFFGTAGVTAAGAVMDSTPSEVPVKHAILASAKQSFLLADAEKFPGEGFLKVCDVTRFRALITDRKPALDLPEGADVEVVVT